MKFEVDGSGIPINIPYNPEILKGQPIQGLSPMILKIVPTQVSVVGVGK